jgi:hypothetical protein
MQKHNRSANKELFALEDKVLDLQIAANKQEGEAKVATLAQLEATKKVLELKRWSKEMAPLPPLTANSDIRTT